MGTMPELYLLHEAALGYALFKGEEFEDIGANLESVQVCVARSDRCECELLLLAHVFVRVATQCNLSSSRFLSSYVDRALLGLYFLASCVSKLCLLCSRCEWSTNHFASQI